MAEPMDDLTTPSVASPTESQGELPTLMSALQSPDLSSRIGKIIDKHLSAAVGTDPPPNGNTEGISDRKSNDSEQISSQNGASSPTFGGLNLADLLSLFAKIGAGLGGGAGGKPHSGSHSESAQRCALLSAIRPYLSPRRREIVDTVLRVERLGNLLSDTLNGTNEKEVKNVLQ